MLDFDEFCLAFSGIIDSSNPQGFSAIIAAEARSAACHVLACVLSVHGEGAGVVCACVCVCVCARVLGWTQMD